MSADCSQKLELSPMSPVSSRFPRFIALIIPPDRYLLLANMGSLTCTTADPRAAWIVADAAPWRFQLRSKSENPSDLW